MATPAMLAVGSIFSNVGSAACTALAVSKTGCAMLWTLRFLVTLAAVPAKGRLAGSTCKGTWREISAEALWTTVFAVVKSEAKDRPHTLRAPFRTL